MILWDKAAIIQLASSLLRAYSGLNQEKEGRIVCHNNGNMLAAVMGFYNGGGCARFIDALQEAVYVIYFHRGQNCCAAYCVDKTLKQCSKIRGEGKGNWFSV